LATGNNNGDLHIVNVSHEKEKIVTLKPHYKQVRTIAFLEDSSKLLTGSDDCSIKLIDIASEKVVATLEGHRHPVSSICCPSSEPKIFYSSSFDKSVKIWDLRAKNCVGTAITSNPLWSCHVSSKKVFAGG
jgi:WD40 repeat protein